MLIPLYYDLTVCAYIMLIFVPVQTEKNVVQGVSHRSTHMPHKRKYTCQKEVTPLQISIKTNVHVDLSQRHVYQKPDKLPNFLHGNPHNQNSFSQLSQMP